MAFHDTGNFFIVAIETLTNRAVKKW